MDPVQDFAVVIGIGLSWIFYSSVVFLIIWIHHKRRALRKTSGVTRLTGHVEFTCLRQVRDFLQPLRLVWLVWKRRREGGFPGFRRGSWAAKYEP
jgi:hypothetical protein